MERGPLTLATDFDTAEFLVELLLLRNAEKYPLAVLVSEFLNAQASYKAVNQDQWVNILDFCSQIEPDLSNYDETSSCTGAPHHHHHTPHAHMHARTHAYPRTREPQPSC